MCSGSYFPPPVRRVDIPKGDSGGTRPLGIPTVSDRIAQMVVKRYLEPILEPRFDKDSYGYRPGKSAHEALSVARRRCWDHDWVLDLDIKSFFDEIDWNLLMRAVRRHTDCKWVVLYLERWLKAPVSMPDGTLVHRGRGTPQGAVVSPALANLFLHYAFRLLDATGASGYSLRTLRRRRYLPLSKRSTGAGITSGAGTEVCGMPATTAPAKDQSRLLQGCKSAWAISRTVFRFSRLHVPAEIGEKP